MPSGQQYLDFLKLMGKNLLERFGQNVLAGADSERIKPLLLDADLKDEFPDYIEGLRLLVSHEEAKKGQSDDDKGQ